MIKAVFFDVDGTLVPYGAHAISDRLREDLLALQERGIKVILATGRGAHDLKSTGMLRDVVFDAYVLLTGQHCYDRDGVYRDVTLPREDLVSASRVLRENPDIIAIFETADGNYLNQINPKVEEFFTFLHTKVYPVRPPEELLDARVYQVVPFVTKEQEDLFLSVMPGATGARWSELAMDIIPKGDGKAEGIRATLARYGLRREEVMAFGDGENDLSMLNIAGIGVAMDNAVDMLKEAADYVTGSVSEDGVSAALRHFGLLPG